jgi:putative aldouronate transport system permease protein
MLMSVPMLLYILLFNYSPIWGWITAFMDYDPAVPLLTNPWVGLENFRWLFGKPEFIRSIRNTFAMASINLVLGFIFPITLALFLNEIRNRSFKRTVQTVTYLPHFLSWVIVVGLAQNIFTSNGIINELLTSLGIIKQPIFFMGEGKYFWWLVGAINVWKECGWNTIIYLAAMAAIDPALYEAAEIDGLSITGYLFKILLPLSGPALATILLFYIVGYWNSYFYSLIFIRDRARWPMQAILREVLMTAQFNTMMYDDAHQNIAPETLKDAMIVVTVIPTICVYPFLQKYFVKGIMVGSIKG